MKASQEHLPEAKQSFLTVQRISQEEIICEGEKSDQLLQSVVCPVCLMLLPMPHYSCDGCDNAFCGGCLEDWWAKHPKSCIFKCQNPNFKLIKRSNTYNALMEILKTKCRHCDSCISIVQLEPHDKTCPNKPINCPQEGCGRAFPRCEIENHQKQCEFKKVECSYCKQSFYRKDLQEHEELLCEVREVTCEYKGCGALIKIKEASHHKQSCLFKPQFCEWCKQGILRKDRGPHQKNCPQRQQMCSWCTKTFKTVEFNSHKEVCSQRKIICQLCSEQVLHTAYNQHRVECMFSCMLDMRRCQNELMEENVKLKMKVHTLQNELQEATRQNQEGAFNALLRIKEEERYQYEKDLQRLNNGITNLQKLRNAELIQHLKKPHISSSLCPFCNSIKNKLEDDIAPLLRQKQEVNQKLREVERIHSVTMSSKIKMSKIRQ